METSRVNPVGLEFHQVSKERWKEFCDVVQQFDESFQELLRNMSESERKSPIGVNRFGVDVDWVLLCQQAHAKVMSTFCEMGKQESLNTVPKVHAQAVTIKQEVQETQLPQIKKVVEEQPVNCKLSELPKDVKIKKEVEENQIDSSVNEMKVEEMEFKTEQVDEDMFPMNLDDINPPPDPSEMKETHKEPDNVEQNRKAASA